MKMPVDGDSVVRFEIAPRSIVLILATIAGVWLAYQLWVVELILVTWGRCVFDEPLCSHCFFRKIARSRASVGRPSSSNFRTAA